MNIHNDDDRLDFDRANAELRATLAISNEPAKRERIAFINAAALVDIADSLRTLAIESALAMGRDGVFDSLDGGLGRSAPEPSSIAELAIEKGVRVRSLSTDAKGVLTGEGGVDQGEAWAEVLWDGDGSTSRTFASFLEAIEPDPTDGGTRGELTDSPFRSPEAEAAYFEKANADLTAVEDEDFSDITPEGAVDAVAALKARQKAAKRGKG